MFKALAVAFLALSAMAVRSDMPPPERAVASVDTVDVSPALDTVIVRTSFTLTARSVDSVGRTKNVPIVWTIRNTALFKSVRQTGTYNTTFSAFAKSDTGRTYIVATQASNSKKDSALVIVRDTVCSETVLGTVNLYPDSTTSHRTDSLGAVATPRNQCGHLLGGVNLTWSSSDSTKAVIDRLDSLVGRIRVLDSGPGTVYIKGVSGTVRDSVKVKYKHAP